MEQPTLFPSAHVDKSCTRCDATFTPTRSQKSWCPSCQRRATADWKSRLGVVTHWTCVRCGLTFTGHKRKFCSSACRAYVRITPVRQPRRPAPCKWCGVEFMPSHARGLAYCSNSCSGKGRSLKALKSTSTPIPWASCLQCRRWFVARRRTKCPHGCKPYWPKVRRHVLTERLKTITCGCGSTFTAVTTTGNRRTCDSCKSAQRAAQGSRSKRRRRARKRGAVVERYERTDIFERDRWRCQLCGGKVRRAAKVPHPRAPVLDHVVPIACGGDDTPANVQCAHFLCNSHKGDRVAGDGEQLRLVG